MVSAEDSSASHGAYIAAFPRTERLVEPPRISIPPPNLDFSQGEPSIVVRHSNSMDYDSNQFGNPAFLEALINDGNVTLTHKMLDWRYDKRREAQMVLPFLYIGPLAAAKNEKYVRETGFTFLISVRSTASGPTRVMDATRMAAQCGLLSYNLDIDSPTDLIRKFPAAIKSINDHLEDTANGNLFHKGEKLQAVPVRGKVLVFCETGNERSAAFVSAYLMAVFNIDVVTAVQTVQSQRFSVSIDDSTKNALGTFGTLLSAKRDVGRANRHSNQALIKGNAWSQTHMSSALPARSKRPLDSVYDDDDNLQPHDRQSGQEQQGRMQAAPFQDVEEQN
jgi:serine/threonine/tyrosine-interacting protein